MSIQKKPTVRYFINGEYREATVSDVGDLENLKTSIKTDLVSAINSIYSGGIDSEKYNEAITKLSKEVSGVSSQVEGINAGIGGRIAEQIKQSTIEMLDDVKKVTDEITKNTAAYKKQLDEIYKDYKEADSRINKNIESTNEAIENTNKRLEEEREKLSGIEIGVNEFKTTLDEVEGKFELYAKKTEIDLMEAQIKENSATVEATAKGLKAKAEQTELDNALDRVAKFEGEIEATAKKVESKLSREEVVKEIDNEKDYGANLIKGTRDWDGWKLIGNAEKLEEKYRNKTILKLTGDNDGFEIDANGLVIGETYTFSVSAMTDGSDVTVTANDKAMSQQSDGDTILGEGYHRLFINIIPKKNSEKIKVKTTGMTTKHFINITSPKLEKGVKNTPWTQHVDDIYEKTVLYESKLKQLADSLDAQLKSVSDINGVVKENNTRIKATSEGVEKVSKTVEKVGVQVNEVESTVKTLSSEVSSKITSVELDKALDKLFLDGDNIIENSAFANDFDNWKEHNGYSITEIDNSKYATITRNRISAVSIAPLTTHYFEVANNEKFNVSFDAVTSNPQSIDDHRIAYIELFDSKGSRLSRKEYKIEDIIGSLIADKVGRAKFSFVVENEAATKAALTMALYKNGNISFSKINITKGNIKNTSWKPSPKDVELITTKLSSEIKQKADGVTVENAKKQIDSMASEFSDIKSKIDVTAEKLESEIVQVKGDMVKKSDMQQTSDGFKKQIVEVTSDFKKQVENMELKHGEDAYVVNVVSTKGNIFRNGVGNTRLMAYVYRGKEDITSKLNAACFSWRRDSDDSEGDIRWNERYAGGVKFIDVTSNDVRKSATFSCSIDIDLAEQILTRRD